MVNHSKKNANIKPKIFVIDQLPKIFFIALRDIAVGEEILYNYGENKKEILAKNAWLKQ